MKKLCSCLTMITPKTLLTRKCKQKRRVWSQSFYRGKIRNKSQSDASSPWDLMIIGKLSVVLNKILHKLRVTEIDEARVLLVEGGNLRHIIVGEREVEDVEILRHALLVS